MPMLPFFQLFPEIAPSETRSVTVLHEYGAVPAGEYGFVELYCNERGCDCENVIINVMDKRGRCLATINHALDRRWSKKAGVAETFLDPLNVQGPHATAFLELFKQIVVDAGYAARLKRHRSMMRRAVEKPRSAFPAHRPSRRPW